MSRLNLTLTPETLSKLKKGARVRRVQVATYTRALIESSLRRMDRAAFAKELANDYLRGREDSAELLREMEAGQLELLGDE